MTTSAAEIPFAARAKTETASRLQLPELDGLRVLAFLLVFTHHMPPAPWPALNVIKVYGWVGVELFFVISAFLFFHLLAVEQDKRGNISVGNFYFRRLLRIFPLLVAYSSVMIWHYGSSDPNWIARLASLLLMVDNLAAWVKGYNTSIPFSDHLWTLSFEFQAYLLIPLAFAARVRLGKRKFLLALTFVATYAFALRIAFVSLPAPHPIVWVTPFLRPDSILLGMALAVVRPAWPWQLSLMVCLVAGAAFISTPVPWQGIHGPALSYPLAALMCAALVDATIRSPLLGRVFGWKPLAALGVISYGLYVFHAWGRVYADGQLLTYLPQMAESGAAKYLALFFAGLALTVTVSVASYFTVERPFLQLKKRFTVADGRN